MPDIRSMDVYGVAIIAEYVPFVPGIIAAFGWKHLDVGQRWFAVMLWFIAINSAASHWWTN